MENRLSEKASSILLLGKEEADRLRNGVIAPEHLILAILRDSNNAAARYLLHLNADFQSLRIRIEKQLSEYTDNAMDRYSSFNEIRMNDETSRIMKLSILEARLLKSDLVYPEHMLLAILRDDNTAVSKALHDFGADYNGAFRFTTNKTEIDMSIDFANDGDEDELDDVTSNRNSVSSKQKYSDSKTPVLDKFGTDVTAMAEQGKLDTVVGRRTEMERVAQILCRRKKNNPVLIGEPGVGKSAIVEGLASLIVRKKVPRLLWNKRIVSLDVASVVAGTKNRGQFEERFRSIISELQSNSNVILYIDEIHTMVGAGSSPGSLDASNILKPYLSRGEFQCIGSTTGDEYRKTIEKDGALERRFQKVIVEPSTREETLLILKNVKDKYEEHHNVHYTDESLNACVDYAERYLSDRFFPDKALDVLDETGARSHMHNMSVPKNIEDKQKEIDAVRERKNLAAGKQDFETAAGLRDREQTLQKELDTMQKEWESQSMSKPETIGTDQIAEVISMMSGVPVKKISSDDNARLLSLGNDLKSKIIAQDSAIDIVVKSIQRSRIGLKNPDKPIGSFLFVGPTGVGKTLLAKELAVQMFGSADALIRIDMSEFMEKFAVSRLVGAPPGYVGYDEGGELTEKIRRRPYSIILLDELEKAHADVFNILLQVMDEGRLTDSNGRVVDFRNTVLIMTSNVGSRQIKEFGHGIGFGADGTNGRNADEVIRKSLDKVFAPEFINRIDDIITFRHLDTEAAKRIVELELSSLVSRVKDLGYDISFTDGAKSFVTERGFNPEYGARPLKRAIQDYVENRLSESILDGKCAAGDRIVMDYSSGSDELSVRVEHPNAD